MQQPQMADSFFGFDTSLGAALDDGLDCLDDEDFEENNYDALNDETFGSAVSEDWEQDHEKLAQITESNRTRFRNDSNKSESEIDVEKSLSHLVLDEKEVTIPRPGVWDSPTNFPIPPPQIPPKPTTLKNVCTVEELERGLMANRPPPGLIKQPVLQQQNTNSGGNMFLNSIVSVDKLNQQINGSGPPPQIQPNKFAIRPVLAVPLPPKFFVPPNVQPLLNQHESLLRCPPIRPPHLWPSVPQRPPIHGNFPPNNLPVNHPLNSGIGPYPFMRPGHPLIPPYGNNHQSMQQHNMHMGMMRNQNNKFNHNDRHDSHHQPFFRNNQFHHQNQMNRFYNNQGFQGHMPVMNLHHHFNNHMNGIGPNGEQDEYAGLMNNREKLWLHNIQLLQLNTNQPYIDDYYYTVFCDRLNKKNENKDKKFYNGKGNNNNNNNGLHRDSREKEQTTFTTKPPNTPMQFENSLGKLQYSSVTAPRKIIDMDVVPNSDPQQAPTIQQKDTKKTRQLLLEIERLYILLLKLEDKSNPLAILAEQQREQQLKEQQQQQQQEGGEPIPEPEIKDPVKEKEELISSLMSSLVQLVQEDKFASFLSIRKGKMLLQRFLACIDMKNDSEKLPILWNAVIKNLAIIGRRDAHLLMNFYLEFQKWLDANSTYDTLLVNLAKEFTESANLPSKINSLTFALTNKFGISVLALMLKQTMENSAVYDLAYSSFSEHWPRFLRVLADSMSNGSPVVAPCELLNADSLKTYLRANGVDLDSHLQTFEIFFTEANPVR